MQDALWKTDLLLTLKWVRIMPILLRKPRVARCEQLVTLQMKRELDPELEKLVAPLNEEQRQDLAHVLECWVYQLRACAPTRPNLQPPLPRLPIEFLQRN
jgi:hypothetical protein